MVNLTFKLYIGKQIIWLFIRNFIDTLAWEAIHVTVSLDFSYHKTIHMIVAKHREST